MRDNRHLPKSHLLHARRIAIIGGGPAGLTLARLLQMRDVEVTLYERDASPSARRQGGSLDLHEDSGQLALRAAGLEEQFHGVSRPEGQNTRVFDRHGRLRAEQTAEDEAVYQPEIDRGTLRALLLASLRPGTIEWDHRLERAERVDGAVRLSFAGGQAVQADLVVGADGGWSKLRPLVSEIEHPAYTGVTFVQARIADVDRRHPQIAALVGPGNVLALGGGQGLLAQRNGDGSIRLYVVQLVPEDWAKSEGRNFADAARSRAELMDRFAGWAPALREMLAACDDDFQPWPLYAYPAEQSWEPRGDVTLIGDAAHIMPPFIGKGANYAMLDALELADRLTANGGGGITAAIAAFEAEMLRRMAPAIHETLATQDLVVAEDAPAQLVELLAAKSTQAAS